MKRYFVACMCSIASCSAFLLRLNINTAIVKMVGNKDTVESQRKIPTYNWNDSTQQIILSAFYYGNVALALPAGWLASVIGGKRSVIFVLLWSSLLSTLIPFAAEFTVLIIILRILDGMGQAILIAANCVLVYNWSLPEERCTLLSITFSGYSISGILVGFISSMLCSEPNIGWPLSFYTYSALGVVIALPWMFFIYETPYDDPCISVSEAEHFKISDKMINRKIRKKDASVPWRNILISSPVWAITIAYSAYVLTYTYIQVELPTFATKILGFDLQTTGMLMLIPGILEFAILLLSGVCVDGVIQRQYLNVLNTRRLILMISLGIPAACLFSVGYVGGLSSIILISVAFGLLGTCAASLAPNALEISTNYAGVIIGLMTTVSQTSGFLGPLGIGLLAGENGTKEDWSLMFKIISGINLFGLIWYSMFAEAEEQDWAKIESIPNHEIKSYKSITE